jgi:hypothetical protein
MYDLKKKISTQITPWLGGASNKLAWTISGWISAGLKSNLILCSVARPNSLTIREQNILFGVHEQIGFFLIRRRANQHITYPVVGSFNQFRANYLQ